MTTAPYAPTNGHSAPTNDTGVPAPWLRLIYRLAGLERGRVYTLTLVVPEKAGAEPAWSIQDAGTLENSKRLVT